MGENQKATGLSGLLDRHFLATAGVAVAAVGIAGTGESAEAAIVYSGIQNVNVPGDANFGLYVNLVTKGTDAAAPLNLPDWDINPYVGQTSQRFRFYNNTGASLVSGGTFAGEENAAKLAAGALIGVGSTFTTDTTPLLATPDGAGGLWDGATTGGGEFLGIRFTEAGVNGGGTLYGWIRVSKLAGTPPIGQANSTHITVVDWAYDDAGGSINAGAVPEPASLSLLAMGAIGLLARRGKVQLRRSA